MMLIRKILLVIQNRMPGPVRRHPWWSTMMVCGVFTIIGIVFAVSRPKQPEYVTAAAKRGDLVQTVEAVGTVISERDLALQFATSGIVQDVLVKEGDNVIAGQMLATLRSGQLAADVASASARVQSARADLDQMLAGSRPEDIAIAEAQLANSRAQLEAAKRTRDKALNTVRTSQTKLDALKSELKINLAGDISTVGSTAEKHITSARTSVGKTDGVFDDNDVQDVLLKSQPGDLNAMRLAGSTASSKLQTALTTVTVSADYNEALTDLQVARDAVSASADYVRRAYDLIDSLPITSQFTTSVREAHKTTLAAEKTNTQTALSALDAALKDLRDASASYITRISTEEANLVAAQSEADRATADIDTYAANVTVSEAQLSLKRAGSRPQEVAAARARLSAAQADLARASASYSDSQLRAPIDGTITKVNVKKGESTPAGAAITLLGMSPFRVEMFASEIDIPKVQLSQSGSVELDAFPGTDFALRVGEVDPAATDVDGVTKYRIKLDFVHPHDDLKIGMTGDAEIVTGMRPGVVSVPLRAVLEDESNGETYVRVILEDGTVEERIVTVGMEGSNGDVEVSGIDEGETVIVLIKE